MSYGEFSLYYDELMQNADYKGLAEYLLELFGRFSGKIPENILDIACGTGSLDVELAKKGIQVIGCDSSEEMLLRAREKADENLDCDLFFLRQKMQELDMLHLVDGAVCTFDGLNHITNTRQLEDVFFRLHLFVRPGGLFIFDVNTPYKHEKILADNAFVFETDDIYCVWQNRYIKSSRSVDITIDMFVPDENTGRYERYFESFRERAYTKRQIEKIINDSGFEILGIFGERSFLKPEAQEQRVFYVTKRKEN